MQVHSSNWRCAALAGLMAVLAAQLFGGTLQVLSVAEPSQGFAANADADSWAPLISPDGRYVLFASTANNLVLTSDSPPTPISSPLKLNVFRRDRASGVTELVSVNLSASGGGNGGSWPAAISVDGRYVAFESNADDLVAGDTNNASDVFVRDMVAGVTRFVSSSSEGNIGNANSRSASMSADGRYVAFVSAASNLVPNDTNGIPDVYLRDMQGETTILLSTGAVPAATILGSTGSSSESPDITPDARCVAFFSTATNLLPGVGTAGDIYLREAGSSTALWVSASGRAALAAAQGTTNGVCYNHTLSADGRFVAYEVSRAPGAGALTPGLILRYNVSSGETDLVHTNAWVPAMPYEDIHNLAITPDGRFIAFVANTNGTSGATTCICIWDAETRTAALASGNLSNAVPAKSLCDKPALSTNGQYVAFLSSATNMVTNALSGDFHAYCRNLQWGVTVLLDADGSGVGSPLNPETSLCLSADGRFAVFECAEGNLVPGKRSQGSEVFCRELASGGVELISVRDDALYPLTAGGSSTFWRASLSADNRCLVFASEANNLVANDTNRYRDVFLHDLVAGTNVLVSTAANGFSGAGLSSEPTISSDGRYVAFASAADNLVAGDSNNATDVFVRDLRSGTTILASMNSGGTGPGNKHSYSPVISGDGRYVLFLSKASNLAPGSFSGTENLFVRDLQAATNYALTTTGVASPSMTRDGHYVSFITDTALYVWDSSSKTRSSVPGLSGLSVAAISPDGNYIAYSASPGLYVHDRTAGTRSLIGLTVSGSHPGLRFSADSRRLVYTELVGGMNQVYLYDRQAATSVLVSHAQGSAAGASGASDWSDISPDGRFVAFRSDATNLISGATNGVPAIYLSDRQSDTTLLLSASRFGAYPAANRSLSPVFSSDSQMLLFVSWAPDLMAGDFNQAADIIAYYIYGSGAIPLFCANVAVGSSSPQRPLLTWPVVPGRTYRVQYKNSLEDPVWQNLCSDVTIMDSQAYCSDVAPGGAHRYYRIVAF